MVDPNVGSWTGNVVTAVKLDATTIGSDTSLPSTWDPNRLFFDTVNGILYKNTGTEGTPSWSAVNTPEFKEISIAETFNPVKQDEVMHLVFEKDGVSSGDVEFYIDAVLQDTYISTSTGQYNKIINPATSVQFISGALTFADTQYNGNFKQPSGMTDQHGVDVSPDGDYVLRAGDQSFAYRTLPTAFDLTTETGGSVDTSSMGSQYSYSCRYGDSGTSMYIGTNSNTVKQLNTDDGAYKFTAPTAGGIVGSFDVSSEVTGNPIFGLEFSTDGTKMYISQGSQADIFQYTLSSAWDITTASFASKYYSTGMATADFRAFAIDSNGVYLYTTTGAASATILHRHTMSTPWDISTASQTDSINISTLLSYTSLKINGGMTVADNDTKILVSTEGGGTEKTWVLELQTTYSGSFKVSIT